MSIQPEIDFHVRDEWDDHAQEVHERVANTTVEQFAALMPEITYPGNNDAAHLVFTPQNGEYDPRQAIPYFYPFANGNALHLGIRAIFLSEITGKKVIAFPNNTLGETYYTLSDQQRKLVSSGNFEPLASKFLQTVLGTINNPSGIEELIPAGFSQAGTVAAAVSANTRAHEQAQTLAVSVQEPANVLVRTPAELRKAFMAAGMEDVYQEMDNSAIPALREALQSNRFAGWVNLAKFALGTQVKPNRDINKGMTQDQLYADLADGLDQSPNTVVQIVGASDSAIFPFEEHRKIVYKLQKNYPNSIVDPVSLEGTHAVGDSVINPALAVNRAIRLAKAA